MQIKEFFSFLYGRISILFSAISPKQSTKKPAATSSKQPTIQRLQQQQQPTTPGQRQQ
jgi:hypothetical protein